MKAKDLKEWVNQLEDDENIVITSMDDNFFEDFECHSIYTDGQAQELILKCYVNDYTHDNDFDMSEHTEPFEDDLDKVTDLIEMIMGTKDKDTCTIDISKAVDEFKKSYSYLNETEIRNTIEKLKDVEVLADLTRKAENLHIEDMNNRPTVWNVTGEQVKSALLEWTLFILSAEKYQEYVELCNSTGV